MKKVAVLCLGLFAGLLLVGVFIAYRLGTFNTVTLSQEPRGPYQIVCLPHSGAYNRIAETILEVEKVLADHTEKVACAIYYDDPAHVPEAQLRSKGGFQVKGQVKVEPPCTIERVPRREVVVARFEGHPSVAPIKVYPKLAGWMAENRLTAAGPTIEFYRPGLIEVEMPVKPAPK